jgi:hypothetical protein
MSKDTHAQVAGTLRSMPSQARDATTETIGRASQEVRATCRIADHAARLLLTNPPCSPTAVPDGRGGGERGRVQGDGHGRGPGRP